MGSAKRIQEIVKQYEGDRTRLLDIVRDVQADEGHISDEALVEIATALGIHRVEVEDMVSFYHFLPREPQGTTTVRLCKANREPASLSKPCRRLGRVSSFRC